MKACFHIHTKYSFDSLMNPKKILKVCKKIGVDTVYITDHNTIRGSIEAKKYEKMLGIEVILGTEIKTQYGDVIGININEEILVKDFEEVLEEIKSQGGISVLPHPYRGHSKIEYLASKVDLIEIWNGHSTPYENQRAFELSQKTKKPPLIGSDAHLYSELYNSWMIFNDILDLNKKFYIKSRSTIFQIEMSNLIGHLKTGRIWSLPKVVGRLIGRYVHENRR